MRAPLLSIIWAFVLCDLSHSSSSEYSFYLEELRFDWNNLNDWDENDCTNTELLHKSHTKLCVRTNHRDSRSPSFHFSSRNNYYNAIDLDFEEDNDWNSISSIDGVNGYAALQKCQSLQLIELCAVYNPYSDHFQINTKILKQRHLKSSTSTTSTSSAHQIDSDTLDVQQLLQQRDLPHFTEIALQHYDDNLRFQNQRM